jgi:2,3-bisphosphoglycerate-independent phosphoglycerate mutase
MKYVILLGDGMADYPVDALNGRTPLECAKTPHMDRIAAEGTLGLVDTIPKGFPPGSDVANLTVLGYDVRDCYEGRGPLEAASMGVALAPDDVAFRCNLVTLGDGQNPTMDAYNAGNISSGEARRIIEDLQQELGNETFRFYPGVSYRHLLVWSGGPEALQTPPPHDISGCATAEYLPQGDGAGAALELMKRARTVLADHPVNRERQASGKKPANSIWLWGQGRAPAMVPLTKQFGLTGSMISAVDLLRGIGVYAGLSIVRVPGATGYIDTDYRGKAAAALEVLSGQDFVFVHVEAPDEMGHEGNVEGKIKAIEDFDAKVVGTVLDGLASMAPYRLLVLSDHPTPIRVKTHVSDPSPFAVLSSEAAENRAEGQPFSEKAAASRGRLVSPGHLLMAKFIRGAI